MSNEKYKQIARQLSNESKKLLEIMDKYPHTPDHLKEQMFDLFYSSAFEYYRGSRRFIDQVIKDPEVDKSNPNINNLIKLISELCDQTAVFLSNLDKDL